MRKRIEDLLETPAYGAAEAARYLRVPLQTLRYWCLGRDPNLPIIEIASNDPPRLSYMNLLECHMLSAMRSLYNLRLPKVRRALRELARHRVSRHPLIYEAFQTNRVEIFIKAFGALINLSQNGQTEIEPILQVHLERIEHNSNGLFRFFPFVEKRSANEPRYILIDPSIGFGKPVLAGTGIATTVIAVPFHARESVSDLAKEYGRSEREIEEAIRWEQPVALAS